MCLSQKGVDGQTVGSLFVRENRFSNAIRLFFGMMAFVDRQQRVLLESMNAAAGADIDGYFGPDHAYHRRNCGSCSVKERDSQGARFVSTLGSFSSCRTNDAYGANCWIMSRRTEKGMAR